MNKKKLPEAESGCEWKLPADAERLQQLIDMMPDAVLIINSKRQTVLCNNVLLQVVNCPDHAQAIGKRPGELFHCLHEFDLGECGSTNFCKYCGATSAIDDSRKGLKTCSECIITDVNLNISHFRVWSNPICINGKKCSFFSIRPQDEQLKQQETERRMFNNLLNMVSNLSEMCAFNNAAEISDTHLTSMKKITGRMENRLMTIRDLLDAESGQIHAVFTKTDSLTVLRESIGFFKDEKIAEGQTIVLEEKSKAIVFNSDAHLIRRILLNMLRNALEAGQAGDIVTASCDTQDNSIVFAIANRQYISQDIQKHLFQKSFATSQDGGYGIYTMKLLAEKYLHGKVDYHTSPEHGTVFRLFLPDKCN